MGNEWLSNCSFVPSILTTQDKIRRKDVVYIGDWFQMPRVALSIGLSRSSMLKLKITVPDICCLFLYEHFVKNF